MNTLIPVIVGALLAAIPSIIVACINKGSEERKHQKELIIKSALENWKQSVEMIKLRGRGSVMPLDDYLVHMTNLSDVMFSRKIDSSNVEQTLTELDDFSNKLIAFREKQAKEKTQK